MTSSKVDGFLERAGQWRPAMERLRAVALGCGLGEELKWGKPCYTVEQGNVAIIQGFKARCALMFFKGALLEDPEGLLEAPGANSRVARRMVFRGLDEVVEREAALRGFIAQAVDIERAGLKVEVEAAPEPTPEELDAAFAEVDGLKAAFEGLTPGRRRAYILHFSGAKRSKTRRSRVDACVPRILEGRGLRD